jgi:hypothetical protein
MATDTDLGAALTWINLIRRSRGLPPLDAIGPWQGCTHPLEGALAPLDVQLRGHLMWIKESPIMSCKAPPAVGRLIDRLFDHPPDGLGHDPAAPCPRRLHRSFCPHSVTARLRSARGL